MSLAARALRRKKAPTPSPGRLITAANPAALLEWYDRHRRILPWRARPGEAADPYRVWLSEIMLQQTTVKAVAGYYLRFLSRWPSVTALAAAPLDDVLREWAGLGYYARARNLHVCAQMIADAHGGQFPRGEDALLDLPGIGPYTAAAIAAIAFDALAVPVDGNVERVLSRLFAIEDELPMAKPVFREHAMSFLPLRRTGDFAQALMDLGATICTPKKPACTLCPWRSACAARKRGDAESFPRKVPKRQGRLRRGAAFVALRGDGHVLVRTRPSRGLLGGMTEVPGSAWSAEFDLRKARTSAPKIGRSIVWRKLPGVVSHAFTHFPLELTVLVGKVPASAKPPQGMRWVRVVDAGREALPNVMRKVLAHALDSGLKRQKKLFGETL